jgi:hypothetical protein
MGETDVNDVILQGPAAWARWRQQHPGHVSFSRPHWYDCPGPGGGQIKGRNRVDFSGMDLSGVEIHGAFAEGLHLRRCVFDGVRFEEGDFSRADFANATFRNTLFNKTILTGANFDGVTMVNCNLNRVNLVGASFRVQEITETVVYGIAAWDLQTSENSKQSKLVIERTYELYSDLVARGVVPMTVDDIELAQFVYYLSNHKKLRDTLNILNDKGALLLGQFAHGGLERLYAMREWLQAHGYMAMIFDFERPDSMSLTETVVTMAGLAKFIVVDLSGPSVPAELQAILAQIKKPVLALGNPYALFADVADQTNVVTMDAAETELAAGLEKGLVELERLHAARMLRLAKRYSRPGV